MNQIQSPYVNFQNPVEQIKIMDERQMPMKDQEIYAKGVAFSSNESILKRSPCYPDSGTNNIVWTNNKPKVTIKESSAVHDVGENDLSYTFAMNSGSAFNSITIPINNNNNGTSRTPGYAIITQYYQYARFNSDIASYTYKYQGSTKAWVDVPDVPTYSRKSSSLHNDFRKRTHKERTNFLFDPDYAGFSTLNTGFDSNNNNAAISSIGMVVPTQSLNPGNTMDYSNLILPVYQDVVREGVAPSNISTTTPINTLAALATAATSPAQSGAANVGVLAGDYAAYNSFYSKTNTLQIKQSLQSETHLIPLTNFSLVNALDGTAVFQQVPILRKYSIKLKDLLHDSFFNTGQMQYHANEAFHEISFNPAPNAIVSQNFFVQFSGDTTNRVITACIPCGNIQPYIGTIPLSISNLMMNMYMETNPVRVAAMQNLTREIVYPVIIDGVGTSTTNALNVSTVNIPGEYGFRLYRIYGALFSNGPLTSNRPTIYNCENVNSTKWNGDLTLSTNGDVISYWNNNTLQADWRTYIQDHFTNSSLNTTKEIDYHGVFVYDYDTFLKDGTMNEYKDNVLKGKILDRNFNVVLSFRNAKAYDGSSNYTNKIFYIQLQKANIAMGRAEFL